MAGPAVQPAMRTPQPLPLAVAALLVATTVGMLEVRFGQKWGAGVHLAIALVAFAGLFFLGTRERHPEGPPVHQSVLLVTAIVLLLVAVFRLGDIVKDEPLESPITVAWMAGLFAAVAAFTALRYGSAVCALFAALGFLTAVLALIAEVNDDLNPKDFRLYLTLLAAGFGAASVWLRRRGRPRHAVQLVNAAALALIGVALTIFVEGVVGAVSEAFSDGELGEGGEAAFATDSGWELILMIGSFWILGYAALRREAGPAWLGALLLNLSIAVAAAPKDPDEASIVGWPLAAILLTAAAFYLAYRPPGGGTPAAMGLGGGVPPGAGARPTAPGFDPPPGAGAQPSATAPGAAPPPTAPGAAPPPDPGAQPTAPGASPPPDPGAQPTAPGFAPPAPGAQPIPPGKIPPPGSAPPPSGPPA